MRHEKSPIHRGLKIASWTIIGVILAVGFAFLFGYVVMWLWNTLMPEIFGLKMITYWQAVGLIILGKLLFGGCGRGGGHGKRKRKKKSWHEDFGSYKNMSGEDWRDFGKFWKDEGKARFDEYRKKDFTTDSFEQDKDDEDISE